LGEFDGKQLTPREYLLPKATSIETPAVALTFQLLSVEVDTIEGQVRVTVTPEIPNGAKVTLLVGEDTTTTSPSITVSSGSPSGPFSSEGYRSAKSLLLRDLR
jgi:hypothetical protein